MSQIDDENARDQMLVSQLRSISANILLVAEQLLGRKRRPKSAQIDVARGYRDAMLAKIADTELRANENRRPWIENNLFERASINILIDLFSSYVQDRAVSVTSSCIASEVPPTTALRYIKMLQDKGLIIRVPDEADARRHWLRLTDEGKSVARQLLSEYAKAWGSEEADVRDASSGQSEGIGPSEKSVFRFDEE